MLHVEIRSGRSFVGRSLALERKIVSQSECWDVPEAENASFLLGSSELIHDFSSGLILIPHMVSLEL